MSIHVTNFAMEQSLVLFDYTIHVVSIFVSIWRFELFMEN